MLANIASAQMVKFKRSYGGPYQDYGRDAKQTIDTGYIVVGATSSYGSGATDIYLIKTSKTGVPIWWKAIGGANIEWGESVVQTQIDSGYAIGGYTNSYGSGGYDFYLAKTDKNGDTLWTKTYGGNGWDLAYCIKQTSDGGYILAGSTYSFGKGGQDIYVVKTNSSGDTLWTKTYGGTGDEEARYIAQNKDGGYIISGYTTSFGNGAYDCYYIRTDMNGDTLWTKTLGGMVDDKFYCGKETPVAGGFIFGGVTKSFGNSGSNDFWLVKTNGSGDTSWTTKIGAFDNEIGYAVDTDGVGGFAIIGLTAGSGYHHIYCERTNGGGWWIWSTSHGTTGEDGYSVNLTYDGGFIICGETTTYSAGQTDVFLVKTNDSLLSSSNVIISSVMEHISNAGRISIYPNPFSYSATLELNAELRNHAPVFELFDMVGNKIMEFEIRNDKSEIQRNSLQNGVYLYRITDSITNEIYAGRIIIAD